MGWVASALSPLWIADQVRNDVTMRCIVFTLAPVSGTGTGFDSSPIKGEGVYGGCCLVYPHVCRPSGLRTKSAMMGSSCLAGPALWILP